MLGFDSYSWQARAQNRAQQSRLVAPSRLREKKLAEQSWQQNVRDTQQKILGGKKNPPEWKFLFQIEIVLKLFSVYLLPIGVYLFFTCQEFVDVSAWACL